MNRVALLLSAVVVALVSGCGKPSGGAASGPAKETAAASGGKPEVTGGRLFAVSFQTMNNPFFVELNEGIKRVVESHGDRLVTLDAQFNSLKQKGDVADVLQQKPAAVFLNPVNWEGVKGTLLEAKRQNVPVIVVDAPVSDPDLVLCQIASDNVEAGQLACQALAKLKPDAKIVIVHYSVNKACIDRVDGFKAEMAKHPGMTLLDTRDAPGTTEAVRPIMRDMLGRFPNLDAVFPINDPGALGCISAVESAGRAGQVTVVTVDGSQEGVRAIQAGKLHSTSAQFPKEIGKVAAEKAYDHLAGKSVEKDIKIPVKLITRENAAEFLKSP
jgi:ribose transport system substrate-binding protein